jgi:hypothetical protein
MGHVTMRYFPASPWLSTPLASNRVPGCVLSLRVMTASASCGGGGGDDDDVDGDGACDAVSGTKL